MSDKQGKLVQFPADMENAIPVEPALLINALKCIDSAAQRGAFYGGELTAVGRVRDGIFAKVEPILKQMEKMQKAQEAAEEKANTEVATEASDETPTS